MTRDVYDRIWGDAGEVRRLLEQQITDWPELFPDGIQDRFHITGSLPESKKIPELRLRQLRLKDGRAFTLRPGFVMPYMIGDVDELDGPLLLLSIGTPCWVVTKLFERNDMFWHRLLERVGRHGS